MLYHSQDEEEGETRDVKVSLSPALFQLVVQLCIQRHGGGPRELSILSHCTY